MVRSEEESAALAKWQAEVSRDEKRAKKDKKKTTKKPKKEKKEKKKKKSSKKDLDDDAPSAEWTEEARAMLLDRVKILVERGKTDAEVMAVLAETYDYEVTPEFTRLAAPVKEQVDAPKLDIRKGFSEAELASQAWRQQEQQQPRPPPPPPPPPQPRGQAGRSREERGRRKRKKSPGRRSPSYGEHDSRSSSSSSRSSYSSYSSRSRSPSKPAPPDPRGPPPPDPRRLIDHDSRAEQIASGFRYDLNMPNWDHDKFDEILREPLEEQRPRLPEQYEPPQPEWFSRAGGVYIKNPRAWLNEPRGGGDDDRPNDGGHYDREPPP